MRKSSLKRKTLFCIFMLLLCGLIYFIVSSVIAFNEYFKYIESESNFGELIEFELEGGGSLHVQSDFLVSSVELIRKEELLCVGFFRNSYIPGKAVRKLPFAYGLMVALRRGTDIACIQLRQSADDIIKTTVNNNIKYLESKGAYLEDRTYPEISANRVFSKLDEINFEEIGLQRLYFRDLREARIWSRLVRVVTPNYGRKVVHYVNYHNLFFSFGSAEPDDFYIVCPDDVSARRRAYIRCQFVAAMDINGKSYLSFIIMSTSGLDEWSAKYQSVRYFIGELQKNARKEF